MATLKEKYKSEIAPQLREELGLSNVMEIPRITKITLNMGVGEAVGDKKVRPEACHYIGPALYRGLQDS